MQETTLQSPGNITGTPAVPTCAHCGEPVDQRGDALSAGAIRNADNVFCCVGCQAVFEILSQHGLCEYYERGENLQTAPFVGVNMRRKELREDEFKVLDDPEIGHTLLAFSSATLSRVVWTIPTMHCASCVWLIERFDRLENGVLAATVDIMRKTVTLDFDSRITSLRKIAERLASIGYAPMLHLEGDMPVKHESTRGLYARIGIAGFAAGNTMMMYIAQYFAGSGGFERPLMMVFRTLSVALSVPVLFYGASPWFVGARAALRGRRINLDVPVALGIAVLFSRSVFDIVSGHGEGYLDSFNGLVFFLLIGRLFQQKAFDALSFDRTYRSFFPLSVRVQRRSNEHPDSETFEVIPIERVKIGDVLSVRHGEVVPCDSVFDSEIGYIDYSFVTGESLPVESLRGSIVYAGGKVMGRAVKLIATKDVSHSELAGMWGRSQSAASTSASDESSSISHYTSVSDRFGQWFTGFAIAVAVAGAVVWLPDWGKAFNIFTAVLIIACPCALTLAAPITLGSAMGRLGSVGIYLKNMGILLELSRIDTIVFDKTGTLTSPKNTIFFQAQRNLTSEESEAIRLVASHSTHPISRAIASELFKHSTLIQAPVAEVDFIREEAGRGIEGHVSGHRILIGSSSFIKEQVGIPVTTTSSTAVAIDGEYVGNFASKPALRSGIGNMLSTLKQKFSLALISGDSDRSETDSISAAVLFEPYFGSDRMTFGCLPESKSRHIAGQRAAGHAILMVGDGLNDAGAMGEANVAIAITDDTATLVPACDVIMRADSLPSLPGLLRYAAAMKRVILVSLGFSVFYNALGLTLAIMGLLSPMIAAILMPISSLTVIAISVGGARRLIRLLPTGIASSRGRREP